MSIIERERVFNRDEWQIENLPPSTQCAAANYINPVCSCQLHQPSVQLPITSTQCAAANYINPVCSCQLHQPSVQLPITSTQCAAANYINPVCSCQLHQPSVQLLITSTQCANPVCSCQLQPSQPGVSSRHAHQVYEHLCLAQEICNQL